MIGRWQAGRRSRGNTDVYKRQASINLALCLGRRVSVLTIMPNILPLVRKQNQDLIQSGRIVSVRSIDTPVLGIDVYKRQSPEAWLEALKQ